MEKEWLNHFLKLEKIGKILKNYDDECWCGCEININRLFSGFYSYACCFYKNATKLLKIYFSFMYVSVFPWIYVCEPSTVWCPRRLAECVWRITEVVTHHMVSGKLTRSSIKAINTNYLWAMSLVLWQLIFRCNFFLFKFLHVFINGRSFTV